MPVLSFVVVPLLCVFVVLTAAGAGLYLTNRYVPMASHIKSILNLGVVLIVRVWPLQAVGLWGNAAGFRFEQ